MANRLAMNSRLPLAALVATLAVVAAALPLAAMAEKADRRKPLEISADRSGTLDYGKQLTVLMGNVVISQGTMAIRAEKVEVRQLPNNNATAMATGEGGKPASFRQKREGVDEHIEGSADRIEYDSRGDIVRFVGNASVRRTRGNTTADEVSGAVISYDNGKETFNVQGSAVASNTPSATRDGRVRMVITPQPEAASAPR
jgi:lipopolysaccharide export system protein LptA